MAQMQPYRFGELSSGRGNLAQSFDARQQLGAFLWQTLQTCPENRFALGIIALVEIFHRRVYGLAKSILIRLGIAATHYLSTQPQKSPIKHYMILPHFVKDLRLQWPQASNTKIMEHRAQPAPADD